MMDVTVGGDGAGQGTREGQKKIKASAKSFVLGLGFQSVLLDLVLEVFPV